MSASAESSSVSSSAVATGSESSPMPHVITITDASNTTCKITMSADVELTVSKPFVFATRDGRFADSVQVVIQPNGFVASSCDRKEEVPASSPSRPVALKVDYSSLDDVVPVDQITNQQSLFDRITRHNPFCTCKTNPLCLTLNRDCPNSVARHMAKSVRSAESYLRSPLVAACPCARGDPVWVKVCEKCFIKKHMGPSDTGAQHDFLQSVYACLKIMALEQLNVMPN